MPLSAHSLALLLTPDELEAAIQRAIEPLRVELARLRSDASTDPVSIPEAARRLGVSVRTIHRWLQEGQLEVVRIGRHRRVRLPGGAPKA